MGFPVVSVFLRYRKDLVMMKRENSLLLYRKQSGAKGKEFFMGSRITSRQVNALVLAENLAKLCIMLPLLINGVWQGRALGVFVFSCLLGAFALGLCERWMWAEDTFFHTVLYKWEIKAVFAMYGALLFFFMAQVPVMIRL